MAIKGNVASNAAISLITRTLGLVLAFFSLGIVTRYLGPENAGSYFTVIAYVGIFSVFADLGLYQILLRDISHPSADEQDVFSSFLSLRAISLLIVLGLLAPLVAWLSPYSPTVRMGILLGSLMFICLSLVTMYIAIFQKHLQMQPVALGEFVARLVQVLLTLTLLRAGFGVLGALTAALAGSALHLAIVSIWARQHVTYRFKMDYSRWKTILRTSYPVALSAIFSFIYFKIDTLMLSLLKSPHDVGVYGLAYKLLEMLVAYPSIYIGLLVPFLARAYTLDREMFLKHMRQIFEALSFVAIPMLFGGVALAGRIIPLFGSGYDASVPTFMILLGATFAIFFGTLYSNALIVIHRQKTLAYIYFWGMLANIAANLYAIPHWSYLGAAWTTLGTEVGVTVAMVVLLKKYGWFAWSGERLLQRIASSICMAGLIWLVASMPLAILVILGVGSYILFSLLFGASTVSDLKKIFRPATA